MHADLAMAQRLKTLREQQIASECAADQCGDHGVCVRGACVCSSGRTGASCEFDSGSSDGHCERHASGDRCSQRTISRTSDATGVSYIQGLGSVYASGVGGKRRAVEAGPAASDLGQGSDFLHAAVAEEAGGAAAKDDASAGGRLFDARFFVDVPDGGERK
jgi:hypothetical protein